MDKSLLEKKKKENYRIVSFRITSAKAYKNRSKKIQKYLKDNISWLS